MSIFDVVPRTDTLPMQPNETTFAFFNRAAGPDYDAARQRIDDWMADVPQAYQDEMRGRISTTRLDQAHSAFWHLYLNHSLRGQGLQVVFEPKFEDDHGNILTPDLVVVVGNQKFAIDTVVLFDEPEIASRDNTQKWIIQEINDRLSERGDTSFLSLDFSVDGNRSGIRPRNFTHRLRMWLDSQESQSQDEAFSFNEEGWDIQISRVAEGREGGQRIVGVTRSGPYWGSAVEDSHDVRDVIKDKTRKYEVLGIPVIPAIQIQRRYSGHTDILCGLYGNFGARQASERAGYVDRSVRGDFDGVWATKDGPDRQWSPGVIAVERTIEFPSADLITPQVWIHPWANQSIAGVFDWDEVVADRSTSSGIRYILKDQ